MTDTDLDFPEVLKRLSGLSLKEVVQQCDTILAQLDVPIVVPMRPEEVRLAASLRSFLFFLNVGKFYPSVAKQDASLYRPVIAGLVHRNELQKTFLDAVDRELASALTQELLRTEKQTPSAPPITP
jgi:hypothetical protein